jgi:hypothetical protein
MASATQTVVDLADNNVVLTLIGQTSAGAVYKLATRTLSTPFQLEYVYKIGAPGAKGNDKIIFTLRDTLNNATTGLHHTGSVKVEVSIPRDSVYTEVKSKDLFSYAASILSDANIALLVDGITP